MWKASYEGNDGGILAAQAGRWRDFKVFMDTNHQPPEDCLNAVHTGAQWQQSELYTEATDHGDQSVASQFHFLGAHTGAEGSWSKVGLIKAFEQYKAATVETPDVDPAAGLAPSDSPYEDAFWQSVGGGGHESRDAR